MANILGTVFNNLNTIATGVQKVQDSLPAGSQQFATDVFNNTASAVAPPSSGTTSGGGGGGSTGGDGMFWDAADGWKQISPPKTSEAELNSIFAPTENFLAGEQARIEGKLPSVLESVNKDYGVQSGILNTGYQQGQTQLGEQDTSAEQARIREENEAARMYGDLFNKGIQRFGGGSSASDAYKATLGREQQRVGSDIGLQYNEAKRAIQTAVFDLGENYKNQKLQLAQRMEELKQNITSQFEDRVASIRAMRAENQSAKAAANVQALQEYRSQMYNLALTNMQYQQSLDQSTQATAAQLNQASQQWDSYVGAGTAGVDNFNSATAGAPTSQISFGASGTGSSGSFSPTGQIASRKEDEYSLFPNSGGAG
jgi:hypothetical protein